MLIYYQCWKCWLFLGFIDKQLKRTAFIQQFSNNINLYYHCFYQFNKSLLNKNEFLSKKLNTDLKLLNGSVTVVYIVTKVIFQINAVLFKHFIHQRILKKVSQVSNIDNKSALHKMHFKVYKNFDKIKAVLITISDFLQKYKIVMYPMYVYIYIYILYICICIYIYIYIYIYNFFFLHCPYFTFESLPLRNSLHVPDLFNVSSLLKCFSCMVSTFVDS